MAYIFFGEYSLIFALPFESTTLFLLPIMDINQNNSGVE